MVKDLTNRVIKCNICGKKGTLNVNVFPVFSKFYDVEGYSHVDCWTGPECFNIIKDNQNNE